MLDYKDTALTKQRTAVADETTRYLNQAVPETANELERIRIICGLSRAQLLHLLHEKPELRVLFTLEDQALKDFNLTPSGAAILPRARAIEKLFVQWQREVLDRIQEDKIYMLREAAAVFDISESYLYILVGRGIAVPSTSTRRKHTFTATALRESFYRACAYTTVEGRKKGPLSDSFLRWLEAHSSVENGGANGAAA